MEAAIGKDIYEKYANFANDRMYTELSRFFNKTLTDAALNHCLPALDLGKQYVIVKK